MNHYSFYVRKVPAVRYSRGPKTHYQVLRINQRYGKGLALPETPVPAIQFRRNQNGIFFNGHRVRVVA
jgi:hypothetical protein